MASLLLPGTPPLLARWGPPCYLFRDVGSLVRWLACSHFCSGWHWTSPLLWCWWGLSQPLAGHLLPMRLFSAVTFFILIFPNLNFCPLYRAWNTHCSVLRVDGACSLALPSQPRCHSHHRPCHSHHWGTLMQQAPPSLPLSSCMTCHSGWCLNFCLVFDFFPVCVLFFSVWHSVYVRIRSWSLVLSWLCFFFDYVLIMSLL